MVKAVPGPRVAPNHCGDGGPKYVIDGKTSTSTIASTISEVIL